MKRNFLKAMAVTGVLLGGSLTASAAERLRVNVPFSFVLAGLEFQPGQYMVDSSNNGVLTVQGAGHGAAVLTIPAELAKSGTATALRFTTDGHEYRLVGLQVEGEVSRAVPEPAYREHKLAIASR
jgi:hypothetical protein